MEDSPERLWEIVDVLNHGAIEVLSHRRLDVPRRARQGGGDREGAVEVPAPVEGLGIEPEIKRP